MRCIDLAGTDPAFSHALEEYYLRQSREEYFLLWRNAPCVLLGRNQNAYAEIDPEFVRAHSLAVIRRITGGGAVFNDLGNFNFAYIVNAGAGAGRVFASFETFTRPLIGALRALGVDAGLSGCNDITQYRGAKSPATRRRASGTAFCITARSGENPCTKENPTGSKSKLRRAPPTALWNGCSTG